MQNIDSWCGNPTSRKSNHIPSSEDYILRIGLVPTSFQRLQFVGPVLESNLFSVDSVLIWSPGAVANLAQLPYVLGRVAVNNLWSRWSLIERTNPSWYGHRLVKLKDLFFFSVFSTGLVRLYIAGLPLRSCQTIGAPSVEGSTQYMSAFLFLAAAGFEPTSWWLPCGRFTAAPLWPPNFDTAVNIVVLVHIIRTWI